MPSSIPSTSLDPQANPRLSEAGPYSLFKKSGPYWIIVNEHSTLADMVSAGHFNWVDPRVAHFPVPQQSVNCDEDEHSVQLLSFDKEMTTEQILEIIEKQDDSPVTFDELVALGTIQPQLQFRFPIVGLGTVCSISGRPLVGCLNRQKSQRRVELCDYNTIWPPAVRFAVIQKSRNI